MLLLLLHWLHYADALGACSLFAVVHSRAWLDGRRDGVSDDAGLGARLGTGLTGCAGGSAAGRLCARRPRGDCAAGVARALIYNPHSCGPAAARPADSPPTTPALAKTTP